MICQLCNEYPATIHITEIINGNKTELNVCAECGKQKGLIGTKISFSLGDLLGGVIEGKAVAKTGNLRGKKCPSCGITFDKLRKVSKLGCQHDLEHFSEWLDPFIEKIHGSSRHIGKHPKKLNVETMKELEIARLKKELEKAINCEDFELAAQLRDQIRQLEEKGR